MLNMIDTQDKLKNFSEEQLIREMQMPSGSAPQFMVLSEIERRKRMRSDAQRQEGLMQPTVAQEAVSAAGVPQQGIAQVAQSLAPKTDMTQNTGVSNMQASKLPGQPNQPQRMAEGGIMRLAPGGFVSGDDMSAIARLKVSNPALYEQYKDNPEELAKLAARLAANNSTMLEELGKSESQGSGGYNAQNSEGYVGKYQFGNDRLDDFRDATGQDFTMEQFKANPALQEEVVQWHRGDILDYAKTKGLDAYKGQTINGVLINDDSMTAMAHLGGNSGMRRFIESGGEYNPADSNGTSLRDYGLKFSGQLNQTSKLLNDPTTNPISQTSNSPDEVAQAILAQKQGLYAPDAIKTTELDKFYPNADPNFVPKAYPGQQVQGGMGLGQILDPNATSVYGGYARDPENPGFVERIAEGVGPFLDRASKGFPRNEGESAFSGFMRDPNNPYSPLDKAVMGMNETGLNKTNQNINNIARFNGAERQGNAMGAAAERYAPPTPYEVKMQKKKDDAERAKRIADEDEAMSKIGIASVKKAPVEKPDDKSFKSTASKLGQSEWLALAQAGLTLMSDPNLANAGKAGLAAYKDLKAIDLAKAKAGMRKPVTGAYLTDMRKQIEALVAERESLKEPKESSILGFGTGKMVDPDKTARERINDRIAELEQAIRQAYRSANINVNPTGSKNSAYDVR
jgi:hypothetical protein